MKVIQYYAGISLILIATGFSTVAQTHTFRFFLHPALVANADFAKRVLPHYVADMNHILTKNTTRWLAFDPATGITATTTKPQTDSAFQLPTEGFEVWAHAALSEKGPFSYGGYAGVDMSGAEVLAGMHWPKLYDPTATTPEEFRDYWRQIDTMLHELAHGFGAGVGEYYKVFNFVDTTGEEPLEPLITSPPSPYWLARPDFLRDPLLKPAVVDTRADALSFVRFCDLTAAIMNGRYRIPAPAPPIADLNHIAVSVRLTNGQPAYGASVKFWRVSRFESELLSSKQASVDGFAEFAWGASRDEAYSDILRQIKVSHALGTASAYVSIFDLEAAAVLQRKARLTVEITLTPREQPPSTVTRTVLLQASPDLITWITLSAFTDTAITNTQRFYRLEIK